MLYVQVNPGRTDGRTYILADKPLSVGRDAENDIVTPQGSMSRLHARITADGESAWVEDLDSRQGTWVNGVRVRRARVEVGESFRCGVVEMKLAGAPPGQQASFTHPVAAPSRDIVGLAQSWRSNKRYAEPDRLEILLTVAGLLAPPIDVDALCARVVELTAAVFDLDRCVLVLRVGDSLQVAAQNPASFVAEGVPYSRSIVNQVVEGGVGALFPETLGDDRLSQAASVRISGIRSVMAAPLVGRGGALGVLYVDHLAAPERYSDADLRLLCAFANQAAMALENARLVEAARLEEGVRATLERFFPPATLRRVLEGGPIETTECEVTALFCDIVGYTTISSAMAPEAVMSLLKAFLPAMSELVFRHEGTLEKYIGDALLAVWGAPYSRPDDAQQALRCAMAMQAEMPKLNARLVESGLRLPGPLAIHIGLHSGRVAAGNLGSDRYVQYATIGDATNVASRVCNSAAADQIVFSEATRVRLGEFVVGAESMGEVALRGKPEPVLLWRLGPTR